MPIRDRRMSNDTATWTCPVCGERVEAEAIVDESFVPRLRRHRAKHEATGMTMKPRPDCPICHGRGWLRVPGFEFDAKADCHCTAAVCNWTDCPLHRPPPRVGAVPDDLTLRGQA